MNNNLEHEARIERLEHLAARSSGGSAPSGNTECYDITQSGIDFPGPTINPADIGPAVQAALDAANAGGGGTVCIPSRGPNLSWTWATAVTVDLTSDRDVLIKGVAEQTVIEVPLVPTVVLLTIANGNPRVGIADLIFTGDTTLGSNVSCLMNLNARLVTIERCSFFGLQAATDRFGVIRANGNTTIVRDTTFTGCGVVVTAIYENGILCLPGATQGAIIDGVRFVDFDSFRGVSYNKSGTINGGWIWINGQDTPPPSTGWGAIEIRGSFFDESCSFSILGFPVGGTQIGHLRVIGCGFNVPHPAFNGGSVRADHTYVLEVEDCTFGRVALGQHAIWIGATDNAFIRRCRFDTHSIFFFPATAPLTYVLLEENLGTYTIDTTTARPTTLQEIINGVKRQWMLLGGGVNLHDVVQISALDTVTQAPAGAADETIFGVCELAGVINDYRPFSLINQANVFVQNDGAAPIVAGTRISVSAVTAGRVAQNAAGTLGIAMDAAIANAVLPATLR